MALVEQGHSPYAWSVLGAAAAVTERIGLMTYVTCPTIRYHPAIVAQKAATIGILSGGRFRLGLGAGENLNEHVVGEGWPAVGSRHTMLSSRRSTSSTPSSTRLSFTDGLAIHPVQLAGNQANVGIKTRMFVALSNNQNVALDIFIHHVPGGYLRYLSCRQCLSLCAGPRCGTSAPGVDQSAGHQRFQ